MSQIYKRVLSPIGDFKGISQRVMRTALLMLSIPPFLIFPAACSGDDELTGYVPQGESISVVKNDLLFPAVGGTATVEVSSAVPVTAELDADWATATVSGQTVSVTAVTNTHYEGRTALLTLRAGDATRRLPVQQRGVIVGVLPLDNSFAPMEGCTYSYTIAHDLPMTLSSPQEWIHATIDGETVTVTIDANPEGHLRRGIVVSQCNNVADTMAIAQYDLENDVLGSYYMMGYNGGPNGLPIATRFDLVQHDGAICMHWTSQDNWASTYLPVTFDAEACTLFLPSAMTLYRNGSNYDMAYFYDSSGVVATSAANGALARLAWSEGSQAVSAVLTAGRWPGHQLAGFLIRSSRGNGLVTTNLLQMANPILVRVGPEGTTMNASPLS